MALPLARIHPGAASVGSPARRGGRRCPGGSGRSVSPPRRFGGVGRRHRGCGCGPDQPHQLIDAQNKIKRPIGGSCHSPAMR